MPGGVDDAAVRKRLLETYNMEIGAGLGPLAGKAFRIGHLGDQNEATILGCVAGVEAAMLALGIPVGHGAAAAIRHLAGD